MISEGEQFLTLADAAKEIPNRRSRLGVNVATVWRWTIRGVRGIRLETELRGGIRFTSREALSRFYQATTAVANGEQPVVRTNRQRQAAIERAERELQAAGV